MSRRHRDWAGWSDDIDESGTHFLVTKNRTTVYVDSYRVPQDAEIATLRAIIENEQQIVERLAGDIARANASVELAQKDVEDLARQLIAAQSALSFATASRDNIVKDQEKYITRIGQMQGVIHPLRRTPTELLGYIFTLAVQESVIDWEIKTSKSEYPRHGGQDPTLLAWKLSQVCRRWRNAALDTPRCGVTFASISGGPLTRYHIALIRLLDGVVQYHWTSICSMPILKILVLFGPLDRAYP
jgi:hypothetical protein